MAVKFTDMDFLRQDPTFGTRVRAGMIQGAVAVGNEDPRTVAFHDKRAAYVAQVMNAPDTFMPLFASACATDSGVINAATANGTVSITSLAIAATQAAVVTDAQITTAIGNVFNAFFAH